VTTKANILPATGVVEEPVQPGQVGETALNQLMHRYADGEDGLFGELHSRLAPRLFRFLLRLSGSSVVTEELLQEAFLRVHRARGSFNRGAAALPWVYAIARNVFLDSERKKKAGGFVVVDAPFAEVRDAAERRPDHILESRRKLDCVRETLQEMPASQRQAFVLLRFEGFSVSDAAEVMGTTEASVKSCAFRAYQALRLAMNAVEGQDDS